MKTILTAFAAIFLAFSAFAHTVEHDAAGPAQPGAAFTLIDEDGKTFTEKDLAGQPTAVFFGFTACPDVCPMTLADLGSLLEELGPDADKLRVVMITVDPETDTPQAMRDYLDNFDPRYIGLTGDAANLDAAARRFYVTSKREAGVITHSASIYLLDETGALKDAIYYREDHATALPKLRALLD